MPTKKTSKKAAPKPRAKKSTTPPPVLGAPRRYSFNVLSEEGGDLVDKVTQGMHDHFGKLRHKTTDFQSAANVRSQMMPLRHFALQRLFGSSGLAEKSLFEIIGPEGVGKTTLILNLMGYAMKVGCPCYFQNTETKELLADRVRRCLSSNKAEAKLMHERLRRDKAHSLDESIEKLEAAIAFYRGKKGEKKDKRAVPMDTPIIAAIDVWGKLMGEGEAAGYYGYGSDLNASDVKKTLKAVGEGSNMQHSKFAQAWCRRLPAWLEENNVILIISSHQNDKVDMGRGGGVTMAADVAAQYNKTKIGGRAFNQTSSYQVIITRQGLLKNAQKEIIGKTLNIRVDKNSYGPGDRKMAYDLITEGLMDTETFQQEALDFDREFARWLVSSKLLGTTVESGRFYSKQLGVDGVTASELYRAFESNTEVWNFLGAHLGIVGYDFAAEKLREELKSSPPIPDDTLPDPPPDDEDELPAPPPDEPEITNGQSSAPVN